MPTSLFTTVRSPVLSGLTEMFKTAKQRKKEKEESEARIAAEDAAAAAAHEARTAAYRAGHEQRLNWNHRTLLAPESKPSNQRGGTRRKPKSYRRKSKTRRRKPKSHRRKH